MEKGTFNKRIVGIVVSVAAMRQRSGGNALSGARRRLDTGAVPDMLLVPQ